jgi:predicted CoA-binding protein
MTPEAASVLASARTILVVDWPTRDVPDTLVRAGYEVVVHGGPGPEDYTAYEGSGEEVVERRVGRPPAHADVVYTFRPLDELPEIVAMARTVGAGTVWVQSGRAPDGSKDPEGCWLPAEAAAGARATVEAAGLTYVDAPYLAAAVRSRR